MHRDHPLSPETTALLDEQEPRRRLAAMLAMRWFFPWLDGDPGWRERYAATEREVGADADEIRAEAVRLINRAGEEYDPARRLRPGRAKRQGGEAGRAVGRARMERA